MSWELLPPWSSSALQEQKSPEGNIAHACVAGRPRITGEGGGGKGAHGGPCGHPGRTKQGARDFFAEGTTPCRSLFLNTPSPPPQHTHCVVLCLAVSLGLCLCPRTHRRTPHAHTHAAHTAPRGSYTPHTYPPPPIHTHTHTHTHTAAHSPPTQHHLGMSQTRHTCLTPPPPRPTLCVPVPSFSPSFLCRRPSASRSPPSTFTGQSAFKMSLPVLNTPWT